MNIRHWNERAKGQAEQWDRDSEDILTFPPLCAIHCDTLYCVKLEPSSPSMLISVELFEYTQLRYRQAHPGSPLLAS